MSLQHETYGHQALTLRLYVCMYVCTAYVETSFSNLMFIADPISILFGCFKGSECLLLAIKEPCQSSTAIGSRQHQSITPGTVNTATGGQDPLSPVSFNLVVVDMKTKLLTLPKAHTNLFLFIST